MTSLSMVSDIYKGKASEETLEFLEKEIIDIGLDLLAIQSNFYINVHILFE